MKKIMLLIFLGVLLIKNGYATEPFASEEYVSESGRYHVVLNPGLRGEYPDSQLIVLSDEEENKNYSFSVEELGLDFSHPNMIMSTAGLGWYRNSIAVFDEEESFFIIKLSGSQYVVIDLQEYAVEKEPSAELLNNARILMGTLALQWLDSDSPYKRQTGAIVCKDLKISEGIPRLKELLNDKEFFTTSSGNMDEGTLVLYVRKAAKEALNELGVVVEHVITELPEKDCLTFKDSQYQIDWNNEECGYQISDEINCGHLDQEIHTLVKEIQSCESDNECIVDYSFLYNEIFGWYLPRSRVYDDGEYLSILEEKVIQYRQECQERETKLIDPPPIPETICESNKCAALY